jgi:hypothetical protein
MGETTLKKAMAGSAHSPTLDTIRMVKDFIREHSEECRRSGNGAARLQDTAARQARDFEKIRRQRQV